MWSVISAAKEKKESYLFAILLLIMRQRQHVTESFDIKYPSCQECLVEELYRILELSGTQVQCSLVCSEYQQNRRALIFF